jgi:hypothetical protein
MSQVPKPPKTLALLMIVRFVIPMFHGIITKSGQRNSQRRRRRSGWWVHYRAESFARARTNVDMNAPFMLIKCTVICLCALDLFHNHRTGKNLRAAREQWS